MTVRSIHQTTTLPRASAPRELQETPSTVRSGKVMELQRALKAAGLYPFKIDGWFGPKTLAGLKSFQKSATLPETGRAGPQAWEALRQQGLTASGWNDSFSDPTESSGPRRTTFPRGGGSSLRSSFDGAPGVGPMESSGPLRDGIGGMLDWARSKIGSPYAAVNPFRFGDVPWDGGAHRSVNGSDSVWQYPKGTQVFDCSGFVVGAFRQLGVDLAARGITSSSAMRSNSSFLQNVGRDGLQPGDLITYAPKNGVGHVVIYLGNGQAIEAAGGAGVTVRPVDWSRADAFKRVPLG
ncbi:MAG: NlpC/P60 family protein [Myxococcota bacterium]|nr:NlpC/P60 family protein [Myxococcota bacterium]